MRPVPLRVLIVPTTRTTLALARRAVARDTNVAVVGTRYFPGLSPSELLSITPLPRTVVSFSDQLTSPLDAIVPTHELGVWKFVSAIEFVLAVRHGYTIKVWSHRGARFGVCPPILEELARAISLYLAACEDLGDDWLARPLQLDRTPEWRAMTVQFGIRQLKSSLLRELSMDSGERQDLSDSLRALCSHEKDVSGWLRQYAS